MSSTNSPTRTRSRHRKKSKEALHIRVEKHVEVHSDPDVAPFTVSSGNSRQSRASSSTSKCLITLFLVFHVVYMAYLGIAWWNDHEMHELGECAQPGELVPRRHYELWEKVNRGLSSEKFKMKAITLLGDAVRIPTETYDNMGEVGEDPQWDKFIPFHAYLKVAFPHSSLKLTKVNKFGLLYEWRGTQPDLRPILLAAHQDVVPVENSTRSSWVHEPFSGYYDGVRIWGRGSSDDKSGLVGSLAAVETLLQSGFQPERGVVLAFGFDEEASGFHGAGTLAGAIKDIYGEKGIAMIVDEGAGFYNQFGSVIALPGIAEKGLYNIRVEVRTPGGHSSVPPDHTSIGILADILSHLEKNPFPAPLTRNQPLFQSLQCVSRHAKAVSPSLRHTIRWSLYSNLLLKLVERKLFKSSLFKSLVGTTQAIDMVHGGVKSNALPEDAWAIVNHRVSVTSSLGEVQRRYVELLKPLAKRHNLTFTAFDKVILGEHGAESPRQLVVKNATLHGLEPAPVTPTGKDSGAYQLLAGTIKATYRSHRGLNSSDEMVIAPGMMPGNTDTRYYWDLTDNIFRYNHYHNLIPAARGVHTVNEHIEADVFVEMIRFFVTIILNADEATNL
ncbi:carboxypeptidase s [Coprinopsis cinerea okayama7|uniref:Carboxypeptidase s n=1 Tax=Coprinopsis cinerea (strain Okayama-7 / 130 / ATCC MYA-4618 / FGSC 9003) TaxID=240176 RepID=D6RNJ2_COPC7|nr:carboxypeptidase s [Coprinopsis cinerea okayama7\|eukprot:XP_002910902.1 carboxypeptidase s [Coprinopsis cinerea okayama7\